MPATRSDDFQRSHPSRHQRQRDPQVATDLPESSARNTAGVRYGNTPIICRCIARIKSSGVLVLRLLV